MSLRGKSTGTASLAFVPIMLTCVDFVLRSYPALGNLERSTRIISRYLGVPPSLLLSEACSLGTTAMLDWIWMTSCTHVEDRMSGWSLTNYLRSDPYYHQWQFAKSLYAAAERGDVVIVEWLFAHFSCCEAPSKVVEVAARCGHLRVLRFFWEYRSSNRTESETERSTSPLTGNCGVQSTCTVRFDKSYSGNYWGYAIISKAIENGELVQCLDEGMVLHVNDRVSAISHSLRLGNVEFAEQLVPQGKSILQYAIYCRRPDIIARMIDEGYLNWDEQSAATCFSHLAAHGSVERMQQILQLHSPIPQDHKLWKHAWDKAVKVASCNGNLTVLMWLIDHSLGRELCVEIRTEKNAWKFKQLLLGAAKNGHVEVMQYLYENELGKVSVRFDDVAPHWPLESVKWLVNHNLVGDQRSFSYAIAQAALYGRLDILKLFHSLDSPGGYEAVGLKRRKTTPTFSLWGGQRDTFYWAAEGGHVDILKWLTVNHPAECGKDAMDTAAYLGHIDAARWLHENRTEGCSWNAMHLAVKHGHFEVVKWLYVNHPEARPTDVIARAIRYNELRIAHWLARQSPDYSIPTYCSEDHEKGIFHGCWYLDKPLEVLLFLHATHPYVFTAKFLQLIREKYSSDTLSFQSKIVLGWVHGNYPRQDELKE